MGQPRIIKPLPKERSINQEQDFSLVLGGPLYQMYLRMRLARPPLQLLVRRVVGLSLICWAPLFVLASIARRLTGGVPLPFLQDPEVHVRFLLALPLMIAAEVTVHQRMRDIAPQFLARGIVAGEDKARFEKIFNSAMRLRNSVAIELVLFILTITLGHWYWMHNLTLSVSSWYGDYSHAGLHLTAAGWWYAFVSLTIFRFILLRWYFRIFIWYRFAWQVKDLPLHFNLFHPDRVGGLGFLSESAIAIAPVLVAQTMVAAGNIYDRILHTGQRLPGFKFEIAGILVFAVLVLVIPLGFFVVQLERVARRAKREFGTLASHYVDDFHRKWIEGQGGTEAQLLGTSDIQSLADLANSFSVVSQIRLFPINKETLLRVVIVVLLPFLPLTLTMIPLEEILKRLFKLAF